MSTIIHTHIDTNSISSKLRPHRPLTLSAGQIFQGKITKIYPNNLATLSLRDRSITARLEIGLQVGNRYLFEVQGGSESVPRVRVLQSHMGGGVLASSSFDQLVRLLSIPNHSAVEKLVRQLMAQHIPFSKQTLHDGIQLLQRLNDFSPSAIKTVVSLLERELPLTVETFKSVRAVTSHPSIQQLLQSLSTELQGYPTPLTNKANELISNVMTSSQIKQHLSFLQGLLLQFGNGDEGARQLLIRLGLFENVSSTQLMSQFQKAVLQTSNQTIVSQLWPHIHIDDVVAQFKGDYKGFFTYMMNELYGGESNNRVNEQLLRLFQTKDEYQTIQTRWNALPNELLTETETKTIQQTLQLMRTSDQSNFSSHIRTLLHVLGYQYEHDVYEMLQESNVSNRQGYERLKSVLLSLLQKDLPPSLSEQVSTTVHRLTGQQLLFHEQGSFKQWIMQIPVSFGQFQTDATIQWEGKEKESGKLDPNYCRILFYVTLEQLKETVIDVQIQNRVISISIFNDRKKPPFFDMLIPTIQQALENENYYVSSVKWKQAEQAKVRRPNQYEPQMTYKGVDIRI